VGSSQTGRTVRVLLKHALRNAPLSLAPMSPRAATRTRLLLSREGGHELVVTDIGVKHAPGADAARDCFCHLEADRADERIGDLAIAPTAGGRASAWPRRRSSARSPGRRSQSVTIQRSRSCRSS
jgi:hypothetical protein